MRALTSITGAITLLFVAAVNTRAQSPSKSAEQPGRLRQRARHQRPACGQRACCGAKDGLLPGEQASPRALPGQDDVQPGEVVCFQPR